MQRPEAPPRELPNHNPSADVRLRERSVQDGCHTKEHAIREKQAWRNEDT